MISDRGTSRRPRTTQVVVDVLVGVALVALGSVVSMPSASASATADGEQSAAAWPARWSAYTHVNGTPVGDVDGDVTPSSLDLASGACPTCTGPADSVAWASDGSNAFFRTRLATGLADTPAPGSPAEAFLVQIADARGEVQAVVGVERTDEQHTVYVADAAGDIVRKVPEAPLGARNLPPADVRTVRAADGSGQVFLDFQVPLDLITTVSAGAVDPSTPIRLYYGSSAAASSSDRLAAITADFMLGDVDAVDFSTLATVRLAPLQHHVVFDSAGGSAVALEAVAEGFRAVAPAPPTRTGHTFTGWFTSATGGAAYDFSAPVIGATTVYAQWAPHSYRVTFDSAGGSAVADQTVDHGDAVALPVDPTRAGDTFLGWFPSASGGKALGPGAQPVTAPTRLYAQWDANSTNDVQESPGAAVPTPAAASPMTSAQPRRRQSPRVDSVPKGGSVQDGTPPVAGASTLRARSVGTTNPVVFYPNGGSAVESQTVAAGDTAAVPAQPTRAGYAFVDWFATPAGDEVWDFAAPIEEATTLYAHWRPVAGNAADVPSTGPGAAGTGDTGTGDAGTADAGTADAGTSDSDSGAGSDAGRDGGRNGAATLPRTGNEVPQALLPAAGLLLLLGLALMTWDRRRPRGVAPGPA